MLKVHFGSQFVNVKLTEFPNEKIQRFIEIARKYCAELKGILNVSHPKHIHTINIIFVKTRLLSNR